MHQVHTVSSSLRYSFYTIPTTGLKAIQQRLILITVTLGNGTQRRGEPQEYADNPTTQLASIQPLTHCTPQRPPPQPNRASATTVASLLKAYLPTGKMRRRI